MRIDSSPLQGQTQASLSFQGGSTQPKTGSLGSEPVRVKDAISALADAAEELSLHNAENVEKKEFAEREIEADHPVEVLMVQEINAYLDAAHALEDPAQLAALAKRMQSSQENPRELARQQSDDPSDQYMLLQHALVDAQQQGLGMEVQDPLMDALADLQMEAGPQIRAGINSIGVAATQGGGAAGVAAFQGTYRDVVLGSNTLSTTLLIVMERLGGPDGEQFVHGLQGLSKALGADLAAARPSMDANRLQSLVQDLYQLSVASTVLDSCKQLAAVQLDKFGNHQLKPVELMKELVSVTGERWVGADRFSALARRFKVEDVGAQIGLMNGLKITMRQMPPAVFSDVEARQGILDAVQSALDAAIDKEDA
jgi:type III secretion protein W